MKTTRGMLPAAQAASLPMDMPGLLSKLLVLILFTKLATCGGYSFTYNGFHGDNLSLSSAAQILPDGLLQLTEMGKREKGYAFHPAPLPLKNSSDGSALSFTTTFVFAMVGEYPGAGGHGLSFLLSSPSKEQSQYYSGLSNQTSGGDPSNHFLAVELDTSRNPESDDVDDGVEIDADDEKSENASTASHSSDRIASLEKMSLLGGKPIQVWLEYDGAEARMNITLSPLGTPKPDTPLLSSAVNLTAVVPDYTYAGLSAEAGYLTTCNYVLGWSFNVNGQTRALDLSLLPSLPRTGCKGRPKFPITTTWLLVTGAAIVLLTVLGIVFLVRRRLKYAELIEDWEVEYGARRFSYKELFLATKGFKDSELLGIGGFGRVYRGTLPTSKADVAVKKVSQESSQGLREFIAEVVSIGRLRHKNIVHLLGYCRRKGELLLVYEFMPHGSLDKLLFHQPSSVLSWGRRFHIIKGIASGLVYLHEEWEQVIVHRDIKAGNVLLDSEFNGRLGDFGLARLYDHGVHPRTTHVVGTLGYIAPELARTGKASRSTDVFAFGAFLLEVACGRRPIEPTAEPGKLKLVDWVLQCWRRGSLLEVVDPNLGTDYVLEEAELVLKLGLLCANSVPAARPPMRQVMRFLDGAAPLPDLSPGNLSDGITALWKDNGFDEFAVSYPSSLDRPFSRSSTPTDGFLSGGR